MPSSVARNFLWIGLGNGVAFLLTFATHVYLARVLQPESYGRIAYALTWANYLALVADLGLGAYGMREVARRRDEATNYLHQVLPTRWVVSIVLVFVFSAVVFLWPASKETKILLTSSALLLLPRALAVDWALQGLERMPLAGFFRALAVAGPLLLYLAAVSDPSHFLRVPFLTLAGLAVPHIAFLAALGWFPKQWRPKGPGPRALVRKAVPFWMLGVLTSLYFGTADIILLGWLGSRTEVGHYSAAFRAMNVLYLTLTWLAAGAFPALSNLGGSDPAAFFQQRRAYLRISLAVGLALLALGLGLAEPAVLWVLGQDYAESVPLFRILMILVGVTAINGPYSQPLLALGHERLVLATVAGAAVLDVALCLALIPLWGARGAAWASASAYAAGTVAVMIAYAAKVRGNRI